jgi:hypothetical protein
VSPPRKRPERTKIGIGPKDQKEPAEPKQHEERERRQTEAPSERAKSRRRKGDNTRPLRPSMLSPLAEPPPPELYNSRPPGTGSYRERKRDSIEIITNRPPARRTGRFGITEEIVTRSQRPDPRRDDDEAGETDHTRPTPVPSSRIRGPTEVGFGPGSMRSAAERITEPGRQPPPHRVDRTEVGIGPKRARAIAERKTERLSAPSERTSGERTMMGVGPDAKTKEHETPPARPSAERTAVGVAPDPAASGSHIAELIDELGDEDEAKRRAAAEMLGRITGVHFGFVAEASKRERDTAQRRYRDWWKSEGKKRFM